MAATVQPQQQPEPEQQRTFAAWTQDGAVGFFVANDYVGQRIVIARAETALPDSAFASVLGGFIVDRCGPIAGGRLQQWQEWVKQPEEAVSNGWLKWQSLGAVTASAEEVGR